MERKAKKNERGLRKKDSPTDRQAAWTIETKKGKKENERANKGRNEGKKQM